MEHGQRRQENKTRKTLHENVWQDPSEEAQDREEESVTPVIERGLAAGMLLVFLACHGIAVGAEYSFKTADAAVKPFLSRGHLTSNGRIADYVRVFDAGDYEIVVRAYGSPLGDVWPLMAVSINEANLETVSVNSAEYRDYRFMVGLSAHVHQVGVAFLNDAWRLTEDRNLYLDVITVRAPAGARAPAAADAAAWAADGPAREETALRHAAETMPRHRMSEASIRVRDRTGAGVAGAVVEVRLVRHAFLFGANLCGFAQFDTPAKNESYRQQFEALFNYATLPFYWHLYEPVKGRLKFEVSEPVVAWCLERGIQMKGHPLLWADKAGVPPWSSGQPAEADQKRYMTELMTRFQGKIGFWDVVNEPVNRPGIAIDGPHRWARELDPEAKIVVNEYGIFYEGHPDFHRFLKAAIERNTPFDVVGIQAHAPTDMAFPLDRVKMILDHYARLGKSIHITEFTPASNGKSITGSPWRGRWTEAQQADYAEEFYRICFAHPAVTAISWWDFCDVGAWAEGGGMIRADLSPKPVYEKLRQIIHEEWATRAEGKTDTTGAFHFKGFHGEYRVVVRHDGKTREATLSIAPDEADESVITLD